MKTKFAVFDMDGTILDTQEDLRLSLNYALAKRGFPERTAAEVRRFLGNGFAALIARGVPEGTPEATTAAVLADFIPHYTAHAADHAAPYRGIPEALRALREAGVKTAVVTNKGDSAAQELVRTYFGGLFDIAVGERPDVRKKPAPDMVFAAMDFLGADVSDTVFIGDSEVDLATARAAGLPAIAVSWGFRDVDFLKAQGAARIVDTAEELVAEILK